MTTNLEQDLTAAGFKPVPIPIDGVVAWTGWHAPDPGGLGVETPATIYETYYDLCTSAMYAQLDLPPWDRPWRTRSFAIERQLMHEYVTVVNCWRSASQVPPAPEAR